MYVDNNKENNIELNEVILNGTIAPDPGGGVVHIRLDFENQQARWVTVACAAGGMFTWNDPAPDNSRFLEAITWFEGNRKFSSSRSNVIKLNAPGVIRPPYQGTYIISKKKSC